MCSAQPIAFAPFTIFTMGVCHRRGVVGWKRECSLHLYTEMVTTYLYRPQRGGRLQPERAISTDT
jgi:hypothetical protein